MVRYLRKSKPRESHALGLKKTVGRWHCDPNILQDFQRFCKKIDISD